jgi:hypothetical protein
MKVFLYLLVLSLTISHKVSAATDEPLRTGLEILMAQEYR